MHLNCFSMSHEAIILKEINWWHCDGNQWEYGCTFLESYLKGSVLFLFLPLQR